MDNLPTTTTDEKPDRFLQFKALWGDLSDYYRRYGGLWAVVVSPYTLGAGFITAACWGSWRASSWPEGPIAVLPALLGFSLAAYALLLAFGDERFRAFLAEEQFDDGGMKVPNDNVLLGMSAIFLHFIIVQALALLLAIVANAHPLTAYGGVVATTNVWFHWGRNAFACFGYFLFLLSLATAVAAALNIYHATRLYVLFKAAERSKTS